ncbi:hypothetical protein PAXRUDRAFT_170975 [Paxillus rubicundulus Ve08.2h10]|uniref:Uncharacterized protein n=1 Tax=Paxillus rubicundulus Ve08.2h10 TaxID=930991 RepID=A0A0D0D780_9AGAM|nr:hypothetical protein PAXRUDRAFT_170975 [Paxillus rubicundulus Ve08.2h10]
MDVEGNTGTATVTVEKLAQAAASCTGLKIHIPACRPAPQLITMEKEVMESISQLKACNRIFGELLTLDQFLEPSEEAEIGDSLEFEGGDETIVAVVSWEMAERKGEVIEVEESDDNDDAEPEISRMDTLNLCQQLEAACLQHGEVSSPVSLDLMRNIQLFRAHLRREELLHAQQTTLHSFFTQ